MGVLVYWDCFCSVLRLWFGFWKGLERGWGEKSGGSSVVCWGVWGYWGLGVRGVLGLRFSCFEVFWQFGVAFFLGCG